MICIKLQANGKKLILFDTHWIENDAIKLLVER